MMAKVLSVSKQRNMMKNLHLNERLRSQKDHG